MLTLASMSGVLPKGSALVCLDFAVAAAAKLHTRPLQDWWFACSAMQHTPTALRGPAGCENKVLWGSVVQQVFDLVGVDCQAGSKGRLHFANRLKACSIRGYFNVCDTDCSKVVHTYGKTGGCQPGAHGAHGPTRLLPMLEFSCWQGALYGC
jgi:hypothetical protein